MAHFYCNVIGSRGTVGKGAGKDSGISATFLTETEASPSVEVRFFHKNGQDHLIVWVGDKKILSMPTTEAAKLDTIREAVGA